MSESDGSAVDVDPVDIDAEFLYAGHGLAGEGLVDLPPVDVADREPSPIEREPAAGHRAVGHDGRIEPDDPPIDDSGQRLVTVGSGSAGRLDDHGSRAVDHARGVAGSHQGVGAEVRAQARQRFLGGCAHEVILVGGGDHAPGSLDCHYLVLEES